MQAAARSRASYDYVLVAGPGRSGSTFLYRLLAAHPAFAAPAIKEGGYYRGVRRFERARLGASSAILLDAANLAWNDPALVNLAALARRGHRILVVVLLRRHSERAASVIAFRRSRVLPALFLSARGQERAALRDSLTPAALERIHGLGVDVLTLAFETLTTEPGTVLGIMARLCATAPFGSPAPAPVNPSVAARNRALAGAGKLAAVLLRRAGAHRLLQRLKDDPRIMRLFFRPAGAPDRVRLGAGAAACLDRRFEACLGTVEDAGERLTTGVWFRPAGAAPAADGAAR